MTPRKPRLYYSGHLWHLRSREHWGLFTTFDSAREYINGGWRKDISIGGVA